MSQQPIPPHQQPGQPYPPPAGQPWPGTQYPPPGWPAPPPRVMPQYHTPPPPPPSRRGRAAIIVLGLLVGAALLTYITVALVSASNARNQESFSGTVPARGIDEVEVRGGLSDIRLTTTGGNAVKWEVETSAAADPDRLVRRDGDTLVITSPEENRPWWLRWAPDFAWSPGMQESITVALPRDLVPDLTLSSGVGEAVVLGDFADVSLDSGVGRVEFVGSADSFSSSSGVGELVAELSTEGEVEVSAGVGTTRLDLGTRAAPEAIHLEGGVGELQVLLPPTTSGYEVRVGSGVGAVRSEAPPPTADGVRASRPVPVTGEGGVGDITLRPSSSSH